MTNCRTNEQGQFHFTKIPFSQSEKGVPLLIEPQESNYPRFARVIIPQREAIPEGEALVGGQAGVYYPNYPEWSNVLEMVATSPSFPEGKQESFILQEVPNTVLTSFSIIRIDLFPYPGIFKSSNKNNVDLMNY